MKILIAGSRNITNKTIINTAIFRGIKKLVPMSNIPDIEIISGGARGVDLEGEAWARSFNYNIIRFPAQWDKYGKRAGYVRNAEMIAIADAVIAIWDGKSRGTEHTINLAKAKNLPCYVEIL